MIEAQRPLGFRVVTRGEVARVVDQAAPEPASSCEAVEPPHQVVRLVRVRVDVLHHPGDVRHRHAPNVDVAGVDLLRRDPDAGDGAEHAEPADHGVEQLGPLGPAGGHALAGGQDDVDVEDGVPDRADLVVVLAVDVHPGGSRQRREHRPRDDPRPEPAGQRSTPQITDRHAGLAVGDPRLLVEGEDLVHPADVEDLAPRVDARVSVAAARTPQRDTGATGSRPGEDGSDLVRALRPPHAAAAADGHPPSLDVLEPAAGPLLAPHPARCSCRAVHGLRCSSCGRAGTGSSG